MAWTRLTFAVTEASVGTPLGVWFRFRRVATNCGPELLAVNLQVPGDARVRLRPPFACTVRTPAYPPDHQRRIPLCELHAVTCAVTLPSTPAGLTRSATPSPCGLQRAENPASSVSPSPSHRNTASGIKMRYRVADGPTAKVEVSMSAKEEGRRASLASSPALNTTLFSHTFLIRLSFFTG
jgi:hypothetical protein